MPRGKRRGISADSFRSPATINTFTAGALESRGIVVARSTSDRNVRRVDAGALARVCAEGTGVSEMIEVMNKLILGCTAAFSRGELCARR